MLNLKLLWIILVAILVMSCNSNEPEIGDDIVIGIEDPTEDPNEDPSDDPSEDPGEEPSEDPNKDPNEDPNEDPYKELSEAMRLFDSQKYDEALVAMHKLVAKYKDYKNDKELFVAKQALVRIVNIYQYTYREKDILPMLEEYSQGDSRFAIFAHYRTAYRYMTLGEYDKAIKIMKETEFSEEDVDMKQARLYDLGIAYYSLLGDKEEAYKYFLELIETYPDCLLARMARTFYRPDPD